MTSSVRIRTRFDPTYGRSNPPFVPLLRLCLQWLLAALVVLAGHSTASSQPTKHALVIGINKYHQSYAIPDLRFAQADAVAIGEILKNRGYQVHLLTTEQATTRNSIVAALNKYARELGPDDDFLLFFAGHGARREMNGKTYWLAFDADVQELDVNGIRLDHLMDYVNDIRSRNKLVLLDHCYAGDVNFRPMEAGAGGSGSRAPGDGARKIDRGVFRVNEVRAELEQERNLTVIAGARNEAYEDSSLGHGVFTKALMEALGEGKADGFAGGHLNDRIDLSELITYTRSRVFALADTTQLHSQGLTQEVISHSVFTNAADFDVLSLPTDNVSQDDIDKFSLVLGKWAGKDVLKPENMVVCIEVLSKKSAGTQLSDFEIKILTRIQQFVAIGGDEAKESAGQALDLAIAGLRGDQ